MIKNLTGNSHNKKNFKIKKKQIEKNYNKNLIKKEKNQKKMKNYYKKIYKKKENIIRNY